MHQVNRDARHRALVAATAVAAFLAAPQVQAFDRVAVGARHFFQCLGLMLSDPDQHSQNCLPNRVVTSYGSISGSGGGSGRLVLVVPPDNVPPDVVTPPPPPPPPEPCSACGACYAT